MRGEGTRFPRTWWSNKNAGELSSQLMSTFRGSFFESEPLSAVRESFVSMKIDEFGFARKMTHRSSSSSLNSVSRTTFVTTIPKGASFVNVISDFDDIAEKRSKSFKGIRFSKSNRTSETYGS